MKCAIAAVNRGAKKSDYGMHFSLHWIAVMCSCLCMRWRHFQLPGFTSPYHEECARVQEIPLAELPACPHASLPAAHMKHAWQIDSNEVKGAAGLQLPVALDGRSAAAHCSLWRTAACGSLKQSRRPQTVAA